MPLGVAAGHERGGRRAVGGAHLVSWASGCRRGCESLDVRLETPFERENRAGIITFHCGSRERDGACLERLLAEGISVSQRYTSGVGGVRVSIHYYNNEDDVERLLAVVGEFLKG